jgi:hypothetical protein
MLKMIDNEDYYKLFKKSYKLLGLLRNNLIGSKGNVYDNWLDFKFNFENLLLSFSNEIIKNENYNLNNLDIDINYYDNYFIDCVNKKIKYNYHNDNEHIVETKILNYIRSIQK